MSAHHYIDETKAKGYVVVAARCPDRTMREVHRVVGRMALPGQRSVHMKHESPRRRRQVADSIALLRGVGVSAVVMDAGTGPEPEHVRRDRALRALVARVAEEAAAHLVLDLDATLLARDRRTLAIATRALPSVSYSHLPLSAEPLLSIPDVIAWSWARGGDSRRRVAPLIADVVDV